MLDPDDNRRAHPRVELLVQVQVRRELEVHIMSTLNISLGGAFVQGDPADYPELQVGTGLELVIFDVEHPGDEDVNLQARVVRREPGSPTLTPGIGLQFVSVDLDTLARLRRLITVAAGS